MTDPVMKMDTGRGPALWSEFLQGVRGQETLGFLYDKILVSSLPLVYGWATLRTFRELYPNLSVGSGARCWGGMSIVMARQSSISIGDNFWAVSDARRAGITLFSKCKLRTFEGASIRIGDGVELNGTSITSRVAVEIGDGSQIAANVIIIDADFHQHWPPESRAQRSDSGRPVTIGRHVWIGMGSLVLKGSNIGDNSIIGAGSVVAGNVPADVVAAGNPARVLRSLRT